MEFRADVYIQDQTARIGCGWRRCKVKVGRRWIRLTEIGSGKTARLPKMTMVGHKAVDTLASLGTRIVA